MTNNQKEKLESGIKKPDSLSGNANYQLLILMLYEKIEELKARVKQYENKITKE